jgi:hypothetical protein
MPALPPIANVLRVAISGVVGTHNWTNILHWEWSGTAPTVASLGNFNDGVDAAWASLMSPFQDTESLMTKVLSTDLTAPTAAQVESAYAAAGTRAGGQLPANASALVDYPISIRYRGGHPRTYLNVGVEADLATPSTWTSGFVGDLTTAWGDFLTAVGELNFDGNVIGAVGAVSYRTALHPRPSPIFLTYTGGEFSVQTELASQRRRIGRK